MTSPKTGDTVRWMDNSARWVEGKIVDWNYNYSVPMAIVLLSTGDHKGEKVIVTPCRFYPNHNPVTPDPSKGRLGRR